MNRAREETSKVIVLLREPQAVEATNGQSRSGIPITTDGHAAKEFFQVTGGQGVQQAVGRQVTDRCCFGFFLHEGECLLVPHPKRWKPGPDPAIRIK